MAGLPLETWAKVFSYLETADLLRCRVITRHHTKEAQKHPYQALYFVEGSRTLSNIRDTQTLQKPLKNQPILLRYSRHIFLQTSSVNPLKHVLYFVHNPLLSQLESIDVHIAAITPWPKTLAICPVVTTSKDWSTLRSLTYTGPVLNGEEERQKPCRMHRLPIPAERQGASVSRERHRTQRNFDPQRHQVSPITSKGEKRVKPSEMRSRWREEAEAQRDEIQMALKTCEEIEEASKKRQTMWQ